MPRTATVSWRITDFRGPRRPRPSSVRFCVSERPMPLLTCVILSLSAMTLPLMSGFGEPRQRRAPAAYEIRDVLAARLGDLLERAQLLERGDGRVDHVVRVRRAERLGEDVGD